MAKVLDVSNFDDTIKEGITLVDFYADWCGPCKMVAPIIEQVSNEVENAEVVKVNVDESPMIGAKYQIRSIPTFIVFKDGEPVNSVVGVNPSKDFYFNLIEDAR